MPHPRLESVICASPSGLHRMAYWEWGEPQHPDVVLCVHGLTRNGRDFDALAQALKGDFRVVCPDIVGRGESDWLPNGLGYSVPQYVADITTLLARVRARRLAWVGTSMGGLIGMAYAGALAAARQAPARHGRQTSLSSGWPALTGMVLNDVGPHVGASGLLRIGAYAGRQGVCDSFAAAVEATRTVAASYGPHSDAQWEALTRYAYTRQGEHWVPNYDPAIASALMPQDVVSQAAAEQLLWRCYESMDGPVLVLRGAQSDILLPATVAAMQAARDDVRVIEFPGVGHAPSLWHDDQISAVAGFVRRAVLQWSA